LLRLFGGDDDDDDEAAAARVAALAAGASGSAGGGDIRRGSDCFCDVCEATPLDADLVNHLTTMRWAECQDTVTVPEGAAEASAPVSVPIKTKDFYCRSVHYLMYSNLTWQDSWSKLRFQSRGERDVRSAMWIGHAVLLISF
jgi:hypothetical protein